MSVLARTLSAQSKKPGKWPLSYGRVAPEWRWAWKDLHGFIPYWEGQELPRGYRTSGILSLTEHNSPSWSVGPEGIFRDFTTTDFARDRLVGPGPSTNTSTWMARFRVLSADDIDYVLGHDTDQVPYFFLRVNNTSFPQALETWVYDGSTLVRIIGEGVVNQNEMTTVIVVLDGTTLRLYQDGTFVASDSGGGLAWSDPPTDLTIAGSPDGGAELDGEFSMVALWDRAMSSDEVAQIARDPFGPFRMARHTIVTGALPSEVAHDVSITFSF